MITVNKLHIIVGERLLVCFVSSAFIPVDLERPIHVIRKPRGFYLFSWQ